MKRSPLISIYKKLWLWLIGLIALSLVAPLVILPLWLSTIRYHNPDPQAILVLEGNPDRIRFAAQFSKSHPRLPIWVSGNPDGLEFNQSIFAQSKVPAQWVYYDFCATDTVTNFTCNVNRFAAKHIHNVYVITSAHHMQRSLTIALVVFGSHGIVATPASVPSDTPPETWLHIGRDYVRCVIWLFTGWTAANLNPHLH